MSYLSPRRYTIDQYAVPEGDFDSPEDVPESLKVIHSLYNTAVAKCAPPTVDNINEVLDDLRCVDTYILRRPESALPLGLAMYASLGGSCNRKGAASWLERLAVVQNSRSCGIGSYLLHHTLDLAAEDGASALHLRPLPNEATIRFYSRNGFEKEDRCSGPMGVLCRRLP